MRALAFDGDGVLWVGTFGGLFAYIGASFRPLDEEQRSVLGSERVTALCRDSRGVLWIGTNDGGLSRVIDGRLERYAGASSLSRVTSIMEAEDGTMWFGGTGLVVLHATGEVEAFGVSDGMGVVTGVSENSADGSIYVSTSQGQWSWSRRGGLRKVHDKPSIGHFLDDGNRLWEVNGEGALFLDGVLAALRSECMRRARRSGVAVTFEGDLVSGEPSGAPSLALFRILQESL